MPPHIYAYTQSVYRQMLSTRQDQSLILMGHSGAGKSYNSKHMLNYLVRVAGSSSTSTSSVFSEAKLAAMHTVLSAFGCAQTQRNAHSNRFLHFFLLEFNHAGQLASLLLQLIVFDPTRLVYQPNAHESNYLVFYYLLYGADLDTLVNDFLVDSVSDLIETHGSNLFFREDNASQMKQQGGTEFNVYKNKYRQLLEAFKVLSFSPGEVKTVLSVLAAICHLGRAGACAPLNSSQPGSQLKVLGQFQSANEAHKAASLLGVSFAQLNECIFSPNSNRYKILFLKI